jgi:glucose/arabinose dehydrogenase
LGNTLGKVIRLTLDGRVPADNPYANTPNALPEIWAFGLRNPYGVAFDSAGTMWEAEHGPAGGDELNVIESSKNYGWPSVSYGNHYDGGLIAKPAPGDGYAPAAKWWTPAIAPSSMLFYNGGEFAAWNGDLIISALLSKALIRVHVSGNSVANGLGTEVQRIDMLERMRAVAQAPDGSLWVLQDGMDKSDHTGQLIKLAPVF